MIRAVDLFCGGGGTSTGLATAAKALGLDRVELLAINHWNVAVETHKAAHPWARHLCATLDSVNPRHVVKGPVDLLVASPECTHHSIARGGKPVSDQSRASAWQVVSWIEALKPAEVLVENVREFRSWGPIDSRGRPLKSKRGDIYRSWLGAIRSLGYTVEERILNAADYGDPTTRERLFVRAHRGRGLVAWPAPSHGKSGGTAMFAAAPWRTAREIIDWTIPGASIFNRKRPLAPTTLERIAEGLRRFGGAAAEPFLVLLRGTAPDQVKCSPHSVDVPLTTVSAGGGHHGLVQSFLVHATHGGRVHDVDKPVPTVTCAARGELGVVQPFVVKTAHKGGNGSYVRPVDDPLYTVATAPGGEIGVVEPFVLAPLGIGRGNAPRSVERPMHTVLASRGGGHLVQPFILPHRQFDGAQVDSVDSPLRTLTAHNGGDNALVEPMLVSYYGNGGATRVSDPVPTVTTKDRFGLVEPGARLDIRFRMLQPHELAAAMGFPSGYPFKGNRGDVIRQIGNAVAVNVATALCRAALARACA